MIVLDASALTDFLLGREDAVAALESIEPGAQPFHAPALIEVETLNALRGMVRGGHVSAERAGIAVADLGQTRRVLYPHGPFRERIWELRDQLTAYDAVYLALAERIGARLVTADSGLAGRARSLTIELLEIGARH